MGDWLGAIKDIFSVGVNAYGAQQQAKAAADAQARADQLKAQQLAAQAEAAKAAASQNQSFIDLQTDALKKAYASLTSPGVFGSPVAAQASQQTSAAGISGMFVMLGAAGLAIWAIFKLAK